jgi:hypothetical protein
MTDARWTLNGGEVRQAIELMVAERRIGALFRLEVERDSLQRGRADGVAPEGEGTLLRLVWDTVVAALPPSTVGRRLGWSTFKFALEGDQLTVAPVGLRVVRALRSVPELAPWRWHLVFTEVFASEPERTFRCDVGYDLRTVKGRTAIVWARPYAGDDWQETQRYPTVTFLNVDP